MAACDIRKTQMSVDTVWHERSPRPAVPLLVGIAPAAIGSPRDTTPLQASSPIRSCALKMPLVSARSDISDASW
jgi:hypothetical protein